MAIATGRRQCLICQNPLHQPVIKDIHAIVVSQKLTSLYHNVQADIIPQLVTSNDMQFREMNEQIGNMMLTLSTIKCPCWVPGGHRYKQQATQHLTWHSADLTQDTDRHRDK